MIVVSDTSCISNLLSVGEESLLVRLFGEVLMPPAVEQVLRRFHKSLPAFLKRAAPADKATLSRLCQELDPGEAEALCLASELRADRLLIDGSVGRRVALREGLSIIGLVGVLVLAKRSGILAAIGPVLQQLENDAGFRLAPSLKIDALRAVGKA